MMCVGVIQNKKRDRMEDLKSGILQTKESVLDQIEPCCFEQTRHSLAAVQHRL